ncbi:MAG TPA: ATP-binding protein, partial [Pseudomonadales bacterium]
DRGAALTEHLLAFGRKQALSPKRLELREAVTRATQLLARTLPGNVAIEVMSTAGMAATADIDEAQLENALLNLGINASDAMPGGGTLSFAVGERRVTEREATADIPPGAYAAITVKDTGQGMSAEVIAKAFDPFFTTKPVGRGTGLGLSMVYGFVKQSKGHIKIYTEQGHGTTVRIYLPKASESKVQDTSRATPQLRGGNEVVLLVEDDEMVRMYAHHLLQDLGYQVLSASNGPEALEMLNQNPTVRLLFTDVIMPGGMNGRQLADAACKLRPDLKVLYTSGYTENAIVHHGRLDPGVILLSKPYQRKDLVNKLRQVLGSDVK